MPPIHCPPRIADPHAHLPASRRELTDSSRWVASATFTFGPGRPHQPGPAMMDTVTVDTYVPVCASAGTNNWKVGVRL